MKMKGGEKPRTRVMSVGYTVWAMQYCTNARVAWVLSVFGSVCELSFVGFSGLQTFHHASKMQEDLIGCSWRSLISRWGPSEEQWGARKRCRMVYGHMQLQ